MKNSLILFLGIGMFAALSLANAQSSTPPNASITLTKDPGNGFFILTLTDPDGIKSFSLNPKNGNLPYSGDFSGCPRTRKIDNIAHINEGTDFDPSMGAFIYDCQNGETEFEIKKTSAGKFAATKVTPVALEPEPKPEPTTPAPSTSSEPKETTQSKSETESKKEGIAYPIPELGSCENEKECKLYCDDTTHMGACLNFAERNGLLTADELEKGKKFKEILRSGGGPGGCKSENACKTYCADVSRLDECVTFAEENDFVKGEELKEIKKIHSIVKSGKALPGNCTNKIACEAYCKNTEHIDECFAFAKENNLMSEEELREAEKFLPLMKRGEMPGACKSKEECEAYCDTDTHMDECIDFAARHDLISAEELEIVKKTGGKGPGGCKGRACRDYCENPENQKACFEFAKEHGILKEEDLKRMEEGRGRLKEELQNMPEEVRACLLKLLGSDGLQAIESGEFSGGRDVGEKMRVCFEENLPAEFKDKFEVGPEGGFHGPGGCTTRDECEAYCKENPETCGMKPMEGSMDREHGEFNSRSGEPYKGMGECATPEECASFKTQFEPPGGSQGRGPGGCGSVEECRAHCTANPDECGGFISPKTPGDMERPVDFTIPTTDFPHQGEYQKQYEGTMQNIEPSVSPTPTTDFLHQDEYQKQYEGIMPSIEPSSVNPTAPTTDLLHQNEYQKQYEGTVPSTEPSISPTPTTDFLHQDEYQKQYEEPYQNLTPLLNLNSLKSSADNLAVILSAFLNFFK